MLVVYLSSHNRIRLNEDNRSNILESGNYYYFWLFPPIIHSETIVITSLFFEKTARILPPIYLFN
jgi:hypothetical protein